jgi:hypothetical protein
VFVVSLHLACPVSVCVCLCCVNEEIYSPCFVCMLVFLLKNILVLHANLFHMFMYIGISFVLFLLYYVWIMLACSIYASLRFPRMHQGLYTYMYIFFSSCSMNNCTFVPYIRTYRIFIACTFLPPALACLNATLSEQVLCAR